MDGKEDRILEAATQLFAKYGLRKTSVAEIAKAADVGKGTIYVFFDTKEALFAAVVRREGEEMLRKIRPAVRKESTAEAKLRAFILARFRHVEELLNLHQVSAEILVEVRPEVESARRESLGQERTLIESIIEEGIERGELTVDDIPLASLTISAALQALDVPWFFEGRELRLDRKVDALLRLLVHGMKHSA